MITRMAVITAKFADESIVDPADCEKYSATTDREARNHEGDRADDTLGQRHRLDRAVQREAEDDRNDDPADAVIDDRRSENDLTDDPAHEIHFAHNHRHDFHRGDRQGRAQKERGDQTFSGVRQHAVRQHLAKPNSAKKRNDDAHQRGKQGSAARLSHKLEICLHPGEQQQQQNAKLRDRIDHRLLFGVLRKECVLQVRKKKAKKGWAKQQSGNQLTHHGRLAQPQHRFAQQSADHHEHDDLCNEDRVGRTLAAFGRPHRRSRKNGQGAQPNAKANHLHSACKLQTPGRISDRIATVFAG